MSAAAPAGRSSSGRPLGTRDSACPDFTAWRLRVRRKGESGRKGISIAEVAQLLTRFGEPTSESAVRGWELGRFKPSSEKVAALARLSAKPLSEIESWFGIVAGQRSA